MWELAAAIVVSITYIIVAGSQLRILNGKSGIPLEKQNIILGFAIFIHFVLCSSSIRTDHGPDISIDNISSLVAALIALMVFLNSFKKPVLSLFIGIAPIAAGALMWSVLATHSDSQTIEHLSPGLATHIILSITSYAFFSIAALQAILLLVLNKKLKQRHNSWNIIKTLPPLQTMEHLLFNMLWTGFILLTGAMVAGVLFVEDLFEQHLVHKTVLSIAAWIVLGTLLLGHQLYGWRGKKAIRWTLGGWALLLLGYFGSKAVLELVLQIPVTS
ncbi:inner membrane protein YpjD [Litoribrevibacter euphylliae]|uniref:Inner membrane protein YpjD n=1 Tax=Litoribrevibacter euphylliae TaxID=1834034 RepID=A0ABV7HDY3_9GAMM